MPRPIKSSRTRTELSLLAFLAGSWHSVPEIWTHLQLDRAKPAVSRRHFNRLLEGIAAAGVELETKPDADDARRVLYRGPAWAKLRAVFAAPVFHESATRRKRPRGRAKR